MSERAFIPNSRRSFLSGLGLAAAAGLGTTPSVAAGALSEEQAAAAGTVGSLTPTQRREKAFQIRRVTALAHRYAPMAIHDTNGDTSRYPNQLGSFTKGLPHNELGEVDMTAYNIYLKALESGTSADFEAIPLGGTIRLVDPMAAYSFNLEGPDTHEVSMPAAPAFASAETAGEMVEGYWQSLTRDVPFSRYETDPLIAEAAADLNKLSDFRGPRENGTVTPKALFRGNAQGNLVGPYVSQFLYLQAPFGAMRMDQRYRVPLTGSDYGTVYTEWLNLQRGFPTAQSLPYDPVARYLRNGRDLGEYVHLDFLFQEVLIAALILMSYGRQALNDGNPYKSSVTQDGFGSFGAPGVVDWVTRATNAALRTAWCPKWLFHRRLRPEAYAGRVQNQLAGNARYAIHADVLNSQVLAANQSKYGTALLALAYPEGSPTHPSYPSGHATMAGAGVTVLKALFDENFVLPNPVVPDSEGTALIPYVGPPLTVGGELNKLAANTGIGRNTAGVHWRTDATNGNQLGEAVAVGILQDLVETTAEHAGPFVFSRFDGTSATICRGC